MAAVTLGGGLVTTMIGTLAWSKRASSIGYTISSMDMSEKQRKQDSERIKLLDRVISTIRPPQ